MNVQLAPTKYKNKCLKLIKANNRILIVENVDHDRVMLTAVMNSLNYNVEHSVNAYEALKKIKDCKTHLTHPYDLIIINVDLPDINGISLIQRLRRNENLKRTKILALTSYEDLLQTCLFVRADAVMKRPISYMKLKKTVHCLLSNRANK